MASDHSFGSNELTPDFVRSKTFTEQDGMIPAADVRQFLENVASALEVFLAGDAQLALRREFARNAEIAQQVLDAGQSAAEQLRRQAADDARNAIEGARASTAQMRAEMEQEIAQSQHQVTEVRARLMDDLRDLHDRIGASLYRFERAIDESGVVAPQEPVSPVSAPSVSEEPYTYAPAPVESDFKVEFDPIPEPDSSSEPSVSAEPSGTLPPAYTQLPDPFAVEEDEPLEPGEPLVDLRSMQEPGDEPSPATSDSWLSMPTEQPDPAPNNELDDDARAEALLAEAEAATSATPAPVDDWLNPAPEVQQPSAPEAATPPAAPTSPDTAQAESSVEPEASADALAVRKLILESIASGQPRDAIEAYLRDHMGFHEPAPLVDAALNAGNI